MERLSEKPCCGGSGCDRCCSVLWLSMGEVQIACTSLHIVTGIDEHRILGQIIDGRGATPSYYLDCWMMDSVISAADFTECQSFGYLVEVAIYILFSE